MSNKENHTFHPSCISSIPNTCDKPPLARKGGRKRKTSHSVLLSIKNVWPPFNKRAKSESTTCSINNSSNNNNDEEYSNRNSINNMGSVCVKNSAEQQSHPSLPKSPRRFASKVAPCMDDGNSAHRNEANNKYMFCTSDSAINVPQDLKTSILLENAQVVDQTEREDQYPEVFSEIPDENEKENVVVDETESGGTVDLATSSASVQFKQTASNGPKTQRSLPNLRTRSASYAKPQKRFSQSETMKTCNGTTNLLEAKQTFAEYRARSMSKSASENVQNVEKRKKRLPTIENGVHVLENDQVNYYQVLEEIGRGSFGSVCKCKSDKDNKCYAMKIISKKRLMRKNRQLSRKPGSKNNPLEPLHREVAILKKMDHPNVVKLIEVIDDTEVDNFYMIFELMDKGLVIDIPTDNPIPEERSRNLFRDLLLGIEYLHYSKIIHRDIKPSNLLLDDNDHIKIADFGVSNMFEGDNDLLSKYAGSPAFQAPEVLDYNAQDKYSGKAADIWAMGVTLYCFLYGKCPFFSENVMELSEMIKTNLVSFPDVPVLNPQVLDLISRMLSKDAKERITMEELKDHPWVTKGGTHLLPSTEDHCTVIEVTEEEVRNSIKIISKVSSLVIAKSILKAKSFLRSKQSKPAK